MTHWSLAPEKGTREPHAAKKKSFDLRGKRFFQKIFSLPHVVPWFPLLGLVPSGSFMGLISTLIYTSELILCSTICVPSAKRHNIHY